MANKIKNLKMDFVGLVSGLIACFCLISLVNASDEGLVAYYSFENNLNDLSGEGNNGQSLSPEYTGGKFGQAHLSTRSNSDIVIKDSKSLRVQSMTIELWIKPDFSDVGDTTNIILSKETNWAAGGYHIDYQHFKTGIMDVIGINFKLMEGGMSAQGYYNTLAPITLEKGKWYFITGTFDGTTRKVYINGQLWENKCHVDGPGGSEWDDKCATKIKIFHDSTSIHIGNSANSYDTKNYWRGAIDEVRIYNRALTESEIKADMVSSSPEMMKKTIQDIISKTQTKIDPLKKENINTEAIEKIISSAEDALQKEAYKTALEQAQDASSKADKISNALPVAEYGNLKLVTDNNIEEDNIFLFSGNDKILQFRAWEIHIKYKGTQKRIFSYDIRDDTLFNSRDSKKVTVVDNKLTVTYFNTAKDPQEISIIFTIQNNTLQCKVKGIFSEPEKFEGMVYGYIFTDLNYETIITPSGEVIENKGNDHWWNKKVEVPPQKNYQIMRSNKTMLFISGNFTTIWNTPYYQGSWYYTGANDGLNIEVQKSIKLDLTKDRYCMDNTECETEKCFKNVCRNQGYCDENSDCTSDQYCKDYTCQYLKQEGASCSGESECITKNCFVGMCIKKENVEMMWAVLILFAFVLILFMLRGYIISKKIRIIKSKMLCPFCLNDVVFVKDKHSYKCPDEKCKQEIPTEYVENFNIPKVVVSAVGFRGNGKTLCFASLFYFLNRLSCIWGKFTNLPLDDNSIKIVADHSKNLAEKNLPPATPCTFPIPSIVEFINIPLFGNKFYIFYDIGGEATDDIVHLAEFAQFIKNSETMTFFISLSDLNEKDLGSRVKNLLDVYIDGYYKIGGRKKSQDLLVVFTKGDKLENMLPEDVWEYLCKSPEEIYGNESRFSDRDMIKHLKRLEYISKRLRNFVDDKLGAKSFTNLADEHFKSVNFLVVSSLGAEPSGGKIQPTPKRVEDILIWPAYLQEKSTLKKLKWRLNLA